MKKKEPTLKMWVRIVLTIILSLGIFIPILELYLHSIEKKQYNEKKIYSYRINKNTDYKVQLFDNNFVEEKEMTSNKIYIADLIKNINMNINYTYSGTKATPLKYTYNIIGKLYGENKDTQNGTPDIVWEKDYNLLGNKTKKVNNNSGFAIAENINIDYPKYKDEVSNFKKRFGMALTTKLKITMNVKIEGKYQQEEIKRNDKIVLDIPVGVQAFSIAEDYEKVSSNDIYEKKTNIKLVNSIFTKICIAISTISTISIILFITLFKLLFGIKTKSAYVKQLKKILKNYGQIIVEVENPIQEKNCDIVKVKNFEEMLDLEEELKLPIIFYEDINHKKAIFTVTKDNTIYQYILEDQLIK